MSNVENNLSDFFKPEERKRGRDLVQKDLVHISSASDTDVRAFVKGSTANKVSLSTVDVASRTFDADCSCTTSRKGLLCKHIWSVLLKLEDKGYDFLASKQDIQKVSRANATQVEATSRRKDFQKERYEKQKDRAKERRLETKQAARTVAYVYPPDVEEARAYFAQNGFAQESPLSLEPLINAKKLLSRIFHPDKGGTHEETVTLNQNFDVISNYLKNEAPG